MFETLQKFSCTRLGIVLGLALAAIVGFSDSLTSRAGASTQMYNGTQGFDLSSSITAFTLSPGGKATSTIRVNPFGGFNSSVYLYTSTLPKGVTAVFNPATAYSTSTLTIAASNKAVAGTYIVNVIAGGGNLKDTLPVTVVINGSGTPTPTVAQVVAKASPASISTAQTSTCSASITGTGAYNSAVTWTATGGTITSAGIFTPSGAGTGTCTAHSAQSGYSNVSGSASIAITAPVVSIVTQVTVVASPASITTAQTSQCSASVTGTGSFSSGISWTATGGTITSSGLFTPSGVGTGICMANSTQTGYTNVSGSASIAITAPVEASFSLSAGSLSLTAGGSASSTINVIDQNGFAGTVSLSASGLPSGVTAAFNPASTSSSSSLTLTSANTAAAGTYPITVTGVSGSLNASAALTLTILASAGGKSTGISITHPEFGFNVLPGSVRRLYATIAGGTTNAVNWSVTGGATLSSTSGHWVDVTAPSTGSHCAINGSSSYTVTSPTTFTVTAQSAENTSVTNAITISFCSPAVQVNVVPFYSTLYAGQKADIQAFVWGASNKNVTWVITAEPNGGDVVLADSGNLDAVFSATVAGRYTLTATSTADSSKSNTATLYVTGHPMTYAVTPSQTEPIDCSVDPALSGTVYDVGPSQPYKNIASVPWTTLAPGSTVRIHNEDMAGGNPTTYHEYVQIAGVNTRTQPIRVCGVPDSRGNLPVLDGSNSKPGVITSYAWIDEQYGLVTIGGNYTSNWYGGYTPIWTGSQYLIVEGLKIQNGKPGYDHTLTNGTSTGAWDLGTACVRIWPSFDTVVRGVDGYNCGDGFFSDFNANNG